MNNPLMKHRPIKATLRSISEVTARPGRIVLGGDDQLLDAVEWPKAKMGKRKLT